MNTKILSYFAAASLVATVAGFAIDQLELTTFAIAVSAMVLLIAATDYAPRRCYHRVQCGKREMLPYAA